MPVPPTAFPWPFKFASGGAGTCAKPSDQSQKGISSMVTGVWPAGSRFQMGVLTNHLGSIRKRPSLVFMSTGEDGGLWGDKVSAIQKGTWLQE
jgi:hypothetical protein